jgi:hypothetical protein
MPWKKFGHHRQLGVRLWDGAFGWRFSGGWVFREATNNTFACGFDTLKDFETRRLVLKP